MLSTSIKCVDWPVEKQNGCLDRTHRNGVEVPEYLQWSGEDKGGTHPGWWRPFLPLCHCLSAVISRYLHPPQQDFFAPFRLLEDSCLRSQKLHLLRTDIPGMNLIPSCRIHSPCISGWASIFLLSPAIPGLPISHHSWGSVGGSRQGRTLLRSVGYTKIVILKNTASKIVGQKEHLVKNSREAFASWMVILSEKEKFDVVS